MPAPSVVPLIRLQLRLMRSACLARCPAASATPQRAATLVSVTPPSVRNTEGLVASPFGQPAQRLTSRRRTSAARLVVRVFVAASGDVVPAPWSYVTSV